MNTGSPAKTERMAKTSRILGILSALLILFPLGLFVWGRIYGPQGDGFSLLGWAFLAVMLMLGSLITGISGLVIALRAIGANEAEGEGDDPKIKKIARTGLTFSLLGLAGIGLIILFAWILSAGNPPPDTQTPIPVTTVP